MLREQAFYKKIEFLNTIRIWKIRGIRNKKMPKNFFAWNKSST